MKQTAEEFFWKNLPKHNLTSQNVIDREKVNFDDIIELMDKYAQQVSRGKDEKIITLVKQKRAMEEELSKKSSVINPDQSRAS